jgi:hypothetical protein
LQKKPQRKITIFDKADPDVLKSEVSAFVDNFLSSNPEKQSVDSNWETITDSLSEIVDKHVPSKLSKGKQNLPWISTVKRRMGKRDKLFSRARKTNKSSDWQAYR